MANEGVPSRVNMAKTDAEMRMKDEQEALELNANTESM